MNREQALAQLTAAGQPYELAPIELYGETVRAFKHAPSTLRALFCQARSEAEFFVYDDERITFEEGWNQAATLANLLVSECGVKPGDRVAISMRNYPEWVLGFIATTSIGGIAVAMNALWQADEMAYALNDSRPKVLLVDEERLQRLAEYDRLDEPPMVFSVRTPVSLSGSRDLAQALEPYDGAAMPDVDIDPHDDATILYTSGSTGYPKGAVSCHRNIVSALFSWELDAQAKLLQTGEAPPAPVQQPATLLAVPLFHATGSHAVFLTAFRAQRRIVSMYKWDVAHAAALIDEEQISSVVAPAAMTGDLVRFAAENGRSLASLAFVGGGGAPRAPEQVKGIEQTFAKALPNTGWGMTETNAIGTGIAGEDYLNRPASSGRCSAVLDLRIVDEEGRSCAPGERGELQVRGTSVIRGYWQRPDANAETFDGRWLKTGDVAYLDEEGYLFIVDRIKDLVIRGGENIGCGAVEAAILEHPGVSEVSVYAVPDERLGEEVGATIYGPDLPSEEALRNFLAPRLARFEIPRYISAWDKPLPRTASGKILKRQLRDEAARRVGKA